MRKKLDVRTEKMLEIIEQGIKLGQQVMESCLKKGSRLRIALFSETYISKLNIVGNKIDRGLSMLSASGVSIQTGRIDGAKQSIRNMKTELMGTSNDVADLLLDIVLSGLRKIPDQVVAQLHERDIVSSTQDCYRQIRDIQLDHDTFRSTKETYDEELLQWVMELSLPPQNPATPAHSIPQSVMRLRH